MTVEGVMMAIVPTDLTRFVANPDRAARIADLSRRQVDYWSRTGVVRPAIDARITKRPIRLYEFADLMSLMVAAELKNRGLSLQHIRVIVERLRDAGYESPLSQLTYATHGKRLYFPHPDGGWEGDALPGQGVIRQVLDLEPMRGRILAAGQRRRDQVGKVERRKGTLGYKPVFAGTRVPVETVRRYIDAGKTAEEIIEAFPTLERADIDAARTLAIA
jgi:uncharacterized protein (DUF433 family)